MFAICLADHRRLRTSDLDGGPHRSMAAMADIGFGVLARVSGTVGGKSHRLGRIENDEAAAFDAAPAFFDRQRSLAKACDYIAVTCPRNFEPELA
jgi:hypothetical protein